MLSIDVLVQPAEERDGLEVLAATVHVRQPFACLPRIVEIEHRRDGVHSETVRVVGAEPVIGTREEEAPDLVAPVVEDQRVPIGVVPTAGIRVLVQMRSVEVRQAVLVGGEVRRHPVEDHAETALMQMVDQEHQILRRPEPARRREISRRLVAPRAVERMLHDRQQLDVGEAEVERVVGELRRDVAIAEPALIRSATPRAEVDLVDRHRRRQPVPLRARGEPLGVAPVVGEIPHDRAGLGRCLRPERERVGLVDAVAVVARTDVEFVGLAFVRPFDTPRPDPGGCDGLERSGSRIPAVEVADHGNALGVRSPDGERRPVGADMGTQLRREPAVRALREEVEIVRGQVLRGDLAHGSVAPPLSPVRRLRSIRSSVEAMSGRRWISSRVHG